MTMDSFTSSSIPGGGGGGGVQMEDIPTSVIPQQSSSDQNRSKNKSHDDKDENHHQSVEAAKDVVYGSIAGIAGKLIEYPFDTIKVRLQSQPDGRPLRYKGPLDCFQQSFRAGGIHSLYRGIGAPMFGAAVETSGLFFSYRIAQELLRRTVYRGAETEGTKDGTGGEELPLHALLVCGSASGAFTSLLLTPVELVKCKMQVPASGGGQQQRHVARGAAAAAAPPAAAPPPPGPMKIISDVFRQDGLLGFWRGQLGTLIRETGGSAAWFGAYEGVSLFFRKRAQRLQLQNQQQQQQQQADIHHHDLKSIQLPIYQQMLAGAAAGVSYNFTFYPADTIKSRLQTEDVSSAASRGGQVKKTFLSVGKTLYRERGIRGLYQGCGITCARAAPSSAFIFTVYEALRFYLW